MAKLRMGLAFVALLLLSGCQTMSYAMQFPMTPSAQFHAGGKFFRAWLHPQENTILLTGGNAQALRSGFVRGATMGMVTGNSPFQQWSAGAHWLADPVGCEVRNLRPIDQTTTWAFDYACPPGVDLRNLLAEHHADLMAGQPLPAAH